MLVWLITVGEPLPDSKDRLWRTGLLAQTLKRRGHQVLWWTSTVNHFSKTFFARGEPRLQTSVGEIQFLDGPLYRRNVGLARIRNHIRIADRFAQRARSESEPDVIVCSFPTIELSREAVRYATERGIPIVLDVRDLWPDIFVTALPKPLRVLGRWGMRGFFRDTAWSIANCTSVVAISDSYRKWALECSGRAPSDTDAVFPLGYPEVEHLPADRDRLQARLGEQGITTEPLVTFVGTFGRSYDLHTVIEAARLVRAPCRIVLCGTGDNESALRKAATNTGVAFTGWLNAGELTCLLQQSVIGLAAYAPQAAQSIPNKIIEYLAAGLPVLTSLRGEAQQMLESRRCGWSYSDPQTLATHIDVLVTQQEIRTAMSKAARQLFEERFGAQAVYGAMADHLERLTPGSLRITAVRG